MYQSKKIVGIEKLNTKNGISFEEMFFGCKRLKRLDLSSLDTGKVNGKPFTAWKSEIYSISNMNNFLSGCNSLSELIFGEKLVFFDGNHYNDKKHLYLDTLEKEKYVIVSPETNSMAPLICAKRDQAIFRKKPSYKKNDIVLFKSRNRKKLVMHRIMAVFNHGYMICGDDDRYAEYVPRRYVYAAVTEIYRKNKHFISGSLIFNMLSRGCIHYNRLRQIYKENESIFWRAMRK